MRVLVDLKTHFAPGDQPLITQVEKVPPALEGTPINGRYVLPVIKGVDFPIDADSYVLDGAGQIDGGDVSSISFSYLLAMYPMFGNIYFNPLLTAADVADLDLTALFRKDNPLPDPPDFFPPRLQTGREAGGPLDDGQMPTGTALLAQNNAVRAPEAARPGLIISDEIDIDAYTGGVGADEFMLYWKLYGFDVQDDINSEYGALAGENRPAIRRVFEVDQEPDGFSAYITPDNGGHWCEVNLLEPIAFCNKTTAFRVAFMNTSDDKTYIANFAVLF